MLTAQQRPRQADRLHGRDLGDEYLFYDSDGARVHVLNSTARGIYLLCDGERTVEDVIGAFRGQHGIDEKTARRDATETLLTLLELGLLSLS